MIIEVKDLRYGSKNDEIIKGISFFINKGDCLSIIGSSGSGKSTFLKLLSDLIPIESGEILFKGKDYKSYSPLELRKDIRYLVQLPCLFGEKVIDNFKLPFEIANETFDLDRVKQMIKKVNLNYSILDKNINDLSGGEKQRIALGRGLLFKPEVLLLDEATSALDKENTEIIEKYIKELNDEGMTIVWVTHNLEQSKRIFNKRITIDSGTIKDLEEF